VVDTDDNTKQFILEQYDKAIDNREGVIQDATPEEITQEVYTKLESEDTDWEDVYRLAEQHEQQYEIVLDQVKSFVDKLNDKNFVKSSDSKNVIESLAEGEKQALKTQVRMQPGKENLIFTDLAIDNEERKILTEQINDEYQKRAFIISNQQEWEGRISLELSRTKERFKLTKVFATKDGETRYQHFGETAKNKGLTQIHSHTHSFYKYKFIADDKEYILLSDEKLEPQRCTVKGTSVNLADYTTLGENRKLPVDQEIIFMHSSKPAIQPLDRKEVDERRERVTHDYLAESIFGKFRHPEWYEKMMLAIWMVKDDNGYPSHYMEMAEAGTGTSSRLEGLAKAADEGKPPFTGTSSTIKGLVPSFSESPPDEGYLMRCERMACVDEKFNLLANTVSNGNTRMEDAFRPMLDLLEHSNREFSSGNGSITGKTEATMIAGGNPAYGIKSIYEALENNKIDEAYLSRFILYDQLQSHIDYIDERKGQFGGNDDQYMPETDDEFLSLMDTMRMWHVEGIDHEKVDDIHKDLLEVVPSVFRRTFKARYKHHINNMVAGMAKYHFLVDERESLAPQEEDYEDAREIMEIVVSSWSDEVDRTKLSHSARINSLNHLERQIWEVVNDEPGIEGPELIKRVEGDKLSWALSDLRKIELMTVVEDDDTKRYYPYWCDEFEEAKEKEEVDF